MVRRARAPASEKEGGAIAVGVFEGKRATECYPFGVDLAG